MVVNASFGEDAFTTFPWRELVVCPSSENHLIVSVLSGRGREYWQKQIVLTLSSQIMTLMTHDDTRIGTVVPSGVAWSLSRYHQSWYFYQSWYTSISEVGITVLQWFFLLLKGQLKSVGRKIMSLRAFCSGVLQSSILSDAYLRSTWRCLGRPTINPGSGVISMLKSVNLQFDVGLIFILFLYRILACQCYTTGFELLLTLLVEHVSHSELTAVFKRNKINQTNNQPNIFFLFGSHWYLV